MIETCVQKRKKTEIYTQKNWLPRWEPVFFIKGNQAIDQSS